MTYMMYKRYATVGLLPCYCLAIAVLSVTNQSSGIENDWEGMSYLLSPTPDPCLLQGSHPKHPKPGLLDRRIQRG